MFLLATGWVIYKFVSGPRSFFYALVGPLVALALLRPALVNLAWAFDKLFVQPLCLGKRLGNWAVAECDDEHASDSKSR